SLPVLNDAVQAPKFQSKQGVSLVGSRVLPLNSSEYVTLHCLPAMIGAGGAGKQLGGAPISSLRQLPASLMIRRFVGARGIPTCATIAATTSNRTLTIDPERARSAPREDPVVLAKIHETARKPAVEKPLIPTDTCVRTAAYVIT